MDRSKAPPLRTIPLKYRPLAPHALAWSCDAELAVAADANIYIFLPEYPTPRQTADDFTVRYQYSLNLQTPGLIRSDPAINAPLCAAAGFRIPPPRIGQDTSFHGVGHGLVTREGAPLSQVVRLEWSPGGLGCNLRPVLTVLLTNGSVVALGENINPRSTMASGMASRGFKSWKILWGLGALLPVPDGQPKQKIKLMDERITSFSWAKEIAPGRALLAYRNDDAEIVIMSIQHYSRADSQPRPDEEAIWEVHEVARFDGSGLHGSVDQADLDFIPHGSALSLKWSSWLEADGHRAATIAYIAKNHVGFRRVTLRGQWEKGSRPNVEVEQADTTSICLYMSAEAFVDWEDAVWAEHGVHVARGVIGTPFATKSFQVSLSGPLEEPKPEHAIWDCGTDYPLESDHSTNPITGFVIHTPDPNNKPEAPQYSLVRLSATSANQDWYETNVPEQDTVVPQWATKIAKETARVVPRIAAMTGLDSDSSSDESDDEMAVDSSSPQVHPYRYRIWGMAASPGGGSTVVLASKHTTQHPVRQPTSRVLFGWRERDEGNPLPPREIPGTVTVEGRLWEWMYGNGGEVPGATSGRMGHSQIQESPLRTLFKDAIPRQRCVFCDTLLHSTGGEATCENKHSFSTCAATGLAIMKPGISRLCAVCELRCLKAAEIVHIAKEIISPDAVVGSLDEVCGGCGGKFLA